MAATGNQRMGQKRRFPACVALWKHPIIKGRQLGGPGALMDGWINSGCDPARKPDRRVRS
jgi:hypothetical protein